MSRRRVQVPCFFTKSSGASACRIAESDPTTAKLHLISFVQFWALSYSQWNAWETAVHCKERSCSSAKEQLWRSS